MPSGVFKVTDIPADRVDTVVADYELQNPTKIERIDQGDGKWTVIATFPGGDHSERIF